MTHGPKKRARGKSFEAGNSGRPSGSRNRSTLIVAELSEEQRANLLRRGYEAAMDGDSQLLKFFLTRILPKDRVIQFDGRVLLDQDAVGVIMQLVSFGDLTPQEGADLARMAVQHIRAMEKPRLAGLPEVFQENQSNDSEDPSNEPQE
jgi:hypothetical protein